ncbi:uncharacterized protein [Arachis hypogaea]|uniref:uncharacterized protein n=1 Tax=Arachis hypogaea TaxID=3818 RepID=UPI000DEC0770|nr:uncharacterized protein LOC112776040 [Arachis hypogaea]
MIRMTSRLLLVGIVMIFRAIHLHHMEVLVGQSFKSKEEAVLSVKDYSIRRGVEYRVIESDNLKYQGRCKEFGNGCTWLIRITLRKWKSTWEVRRIFSLVKADASVTIKMLQEATEATYGFRPSYRKVWLAKQKAMAQIYGDWEESYGDLSHWILGVTSTMDGTVALMKISPVRVVIRLMNLESSFIECFGHSLHVLRHFDTVSRLSLSTAHTCMAKSWAYFLSNLRRHVTPQEGILVISDRHNSIKAALEALDSGWRPPHAYRAFCIRHVATNFALTFKGQDARRWLVNAAYAKMEAEFDYWFDIMRTENPAMCDWANRMEYERWTQHKDGGRQYGHMTTNISECVNSVLKGTRNLPVTSLVKSTYLRLAELFVIRGQTAEAQLASGHRFSQALVKAIERILRDSRCFTVTLFDRH